MHEDTGRPPPDGLRVERAAAALLDELDRLQARDDAPAPPPAARRDAAQPPTGRGIDPAAVEAALARQSHGREALNAAGAESAQRQADAADRERGRWEALPEHERLRQAVIENLAGGRTQDAGTDAPGGTA